MASLHLLGLCSWSLVSKHRSRTYSEVHGNESCMGLSYVSCEAVNGRRFLWKTLGLFSHLYNNSLASSKHMQLRVGSVCSLKMSLGCWSCPLKSSELAWGSCPWLMLESVCQHTSWNLPNLGAISEETISALNFGEFQGTPRSNASHHPLFLIHHCNFSHIK